MADDSSYTAHTVTARKPARCENYIGGGWCPRGIAVGDDYIRHVAFPGHDCNTGTQPWVMRECTSCRTESGKPMPPRRTRKEANHA